jgi:hypothetical protein
VPVAVILVTKGSGKHKKVVAEVSFSDGSVLPEIAVPFQQPRFQNVRATLASVNPAGGSFELRFTARNGKKTVTSNLTL